MKTIIAGSRSIIDSEEINKAVSMSEFEITEVVSGTARGVDKLGESWALENGIPIKQFPADWDKFGRGAGYIRNAQMAEYSDALIAVWDGHSRGTRHMINCAQKKGIHVYVMCV